MGVGSTESFVAPLAALPHGGGAARDLIGRVLGSLDDGVLDLPRGVTALSIFALHVVTWHAGALFFAWLDRSKIADKYKFTRSDTLTYSQMLSVVLFNQCCVMLPVLLLLEVLGALPRASVSALRPLVVARVALACYLFGYFHDAIMYVTHRYVLHSSWGYKRWHALHHKTRASVAASSLYMTPVDFLLEIMLPFLGWFLVVRTEHVATLAIVVGLGGWFAMYEHSGYNFFPGFAPLDTSLHAAHHTKSGVAYSQGLGSPGVMDWLGGTGWRGGGL